MPKGYLKVYDKDKKDVTIELDKNKTSGVSRDYRDAWMVGEDDVITYHTSSLKESLIEKLKVWKTEKQESHFTYAGKEYQCDQRSAELIHGTATLAILTEQSAPGSFTVDWKAKDNSFVEHDAASFTGLFMAMHDHFKNTWDDYVTRRYAIENANTNADVLEVVDDIDLTPALLE